MVKLGISFYYLNIPGSSLGLSMMGGRIFLGGRGNTSVSYKRIASDLLGHLNRYLFFKSPIQVRYTVQLPSHETVVWAIYDIK